MPSNLAIGSFKATFFSFFYSSFFFFFFLFGYINSASWSILFLWMLFPAQPCHNPMPPTHNLSRNGVKLQYSYFKVWMTVISSFLFFSLYSISINYSPEVQHFLGWGQHFPAGLSYPWRRSYPSLPPIQDFRVAVIVTKLK